MIAGSFDRERVIGPGDENDAKNFYTPHVVHIADKNVHHLLKKKILHESVLSFPA